MKKLSDAERDELRKKMAEQRQQSSENLARSLGESEAQDSNLLAYFAKGGIWGGIVLIGLAVFLFIGISAVGEAPAGLSYSPPVLFLVGIVVFIKGIIKAVRTRKEKGTEADE